MRRIPLFAASLFFAVLIVCAALLLPRQHFAAAGGQTVTQLHLEQISAQKTVAAWIPYFTAAELARQDSEADCRKAVSDYLQKARSFGVSDVFVHMCAFGEAFWPSAYYPPAEEANGFDLMQIFSDACAVQGVRLHAWINPLRLQSPARAALWTGDERLAAWFRSPQTRAANLSLHDGRYYLNPACPAVPRFLADAVSELVGRYHPAGVHIDDYFYPTQDPGFDAAAYAGSPPGNLTAYRVDKISQIVRSMCSAVHDSDENALFSISPQGRLAANRSTLYADVARWLAEPGFCDLMLPQLYFGYQHAYCPCAEAAADWLKLPRDTSVRLIPGLAVYKIGQEDLYAGSGQDEWKNDPAVLQRQAVRLLNDPAADGIALYHLDALFALDEDVANPLRAAVLALAEQQKPGE